jgi:predicted PurR-regulated permease PerM
MPVESPELEPIVDQDVVNDTPTIKGDDVVDIPDSWWQRHLHIAVWILVAGGVLAFLRVAAEVVVPFILSGLLFYALDPAVDFLKRWRVPRVIGALLVLGVVVGGVGALALTLRNEVTTIVEGLPEGARRLGAVIRPKGGDSTLDSVKKATTAIDQTAADAAGVSAAPRGVTRVQIEQPLFRTSDFLWSGSMGLAGLVSQIAMVCFLAFFLLLTDDLFKRKLVTHASSTIAGKRITVKVLEDIEHQIERFVLVQMFTSILVAIVTGVALWWLGVQNAAVWGLAAGVFNSVPYLGPFIVTIGLSIVAFLQFGTVEMALLVASVALVITSIEGWLLTPTLIGKTARMNPVAVFAGLLFWSWMWGIWGTLLAVPMMMVVKAICDHIEDFRPVADFLSE